MSSRHQTRIALSLIISLFALTLFIGADCKEKIQTRNFWGPSNQQAQPAAPAPDRSAPGQQAATAPAPEPTLTGQLPPADMNNLTVQSLSLADTSGQVRATLKLDDAGAPAFTLLEPNGTSRARIHLEQNGTVAVDLLDNNGALLTSYWIENNLPYLAYLDRKGKPVTIIPKNGSAPNRFTQPGMAGAGGETGAAGSQAGAASGAGAAGRGGRTAVRRMSEQVFLVPESKTYHFKGCTHLHGAEQNPMTLGDAIAKGYKPCSHCNPPVVESQGGGGQLTPPAR